jgi:predicted nucleic acid-binding protein
LSAAPTGLIDTSVFIASESGRKLRQDQLPLQSVISVITLAELQAGVLIAADTGIRARRLATLEIVADIEVLVIDEVVAQEWARLRVQLAEAARRVSVNDLWIAATALAQGIPVFTQDSDFDPLIELAGLEVVPV